MVNAARRCVRSVWPYEGKFSFTKSGVILGDLLREADRPSTLFDVPRRKSQSLMAALDQINNRFGRKTMTVASEGVERGWALRSDFRSPNYTTRISELPVVR